MEGLDRENKPRRCTCFPQIHACFYTVLHPWGLGLSGLESYLVAGHVGRKISTQSRRMVSLRAAWAKQ